MIEQFLNLVSNRERFSLPTKALILFALVTALGGNAFAQTQATTDVSGAVTSMVASAKDDAGVVPAADNPIAPEAKPAALPVGAGSDHRGYVMARGYFFSINRSGGDPAVIASSAGGVISSVTNFDYGWKSAYKAEAGWNWPSNWGLRGSYFYTNQSAQVNRTGTVGAPFFVSPRPLNVTFTGAADAGTLARFRERFQLHVIDLEGDYKWHNPNWSVLVSAGLRIGISRQTYTAEDTFAGTTENLRYVQERTGYGPTAAIDFRHRIGSSNFWWTGQGRFAVLFGDVDESSLFTSGAFIPPPTLRTDSRSTWVFEGETGLEWSKTIGTWQIFLNGSGVYHYWNDLLNIMPTAAVGGSATASLDNPLLPPTRTGNISFVGGVVTVGFRF